MATESKQLQRQKNSAVPSGFIPRHISEANMATESKYMQRELRLLADVTENLRAVDSKLVSLCDTEQRAFHLCVDMARPRRSQAEIAEALGMSKSDLNCCLNADINNRPKYLSRTRQMALQHVCGNTAIDQWADLHERGMLACQRDQAEEIAELKERLEFLEGRA